MKRTSVVAVLLITISIISSCASVDKQPTITCEGPWAGGPLTETTAEESPPRGMVAMTVRATIKTHPEGFYLLEPQSHTHGKAGFPFVVTIDSKTLEWKDDGRDEMLPQYDAKGNLDPEGGQGVRYMIEKKVLISPGRHRVSLNLPSEERQLTVVVKIAADSRPYTMEFKPVYNGPNTRRFGFRYGIVGMSAFHNGVPLPECTK